MADASSAGDDAPAKVEKTMEPYTVAIDASEIPLRFDVRDGQCVALAGTPRYMSATDLGSAEKDPDVTGSAPYVERLSLAEEGDGAVRLSARLGNNGALVLPDDVEPGPTPEPEPNPTPEPDDPGDAPDLGNDSPARPDERPSEDGQAGASEGGDLPATGGRDDGTVLLVLLFFGASAVATAFVLLWRR
ncbi:MAG: hypothetical protein Q4B91_07580 [Atopobiaceae bacterium]|nr:hypothetical protein [Atopobiaceae bacterium]